MEPRLEFGDWSVICLPEDGGRLARLQYRGRDLLTRPPPLFRPPAADYGRYETRPVFGYDDCFPTVDACRHPDTGQPLPDHGELCWLAWSVRRTTDGLQCECRSRMFPATFTRTLRFAGHILTWHFVLRNDGSVPLRGLHVMHALMLPADIAALTLPECSETAEETESGFPTTSRQADLSRQLLALPKGGYVMLLLRGIRQGEVRVAFKDMGTLTIRFPVDLFPTLGIWWNNGGYPDEVGLRRSECAFEPMPGSSSSLATACAEGSVLDIPASGCQEWAVTWTFDRER
jgi:hypothetical protein